MGYTFISYSRRQLYFAESVALNLQRAGLEIWFDLQKLTAGVEWASALKDGYSNCSKLILIASQFAIQSPYVRIEWETALQNGREVIIVLSEAMVLPEALQSCAVYDARVHFDRTIQSLTAYLRGEEPARHDPVPAPGKSPYTLNMPFDIRLTLFAMFMPTLTAWIATFIIKVLVKSAWGSDDPTKAAFPFLHSNALAEAGHDVQIFLLGEAVSLMRTPVSNAIVPMRWPPLAEILEATIVLQIPIHV